MTMRDEDFAAPARLDEADGEFWSPPMAAPAPKPGKVTTGISTTSISSTAVVGHERNPAVRGGCFLTTAIVERRGIEADDGPTLTALRRFRDGYMMKTPKRRALVAEYYEIAPRIAAAIPQGHSDWDWIGGRIDAAIAAIYAGDEDGAFGIYAAMVRRLAACWTEPDGRMAAGANTTKGT